MHREKEPFNTAIYCTKCSVPLYLVNTHYISMVQETKPVMLCSKCFAGLMKEDAKPVVPQHTYYVYADKTVSNRYTVKATSEQEAIKKVGSGEFDEIGPATHSLPQVFDVCLARENK